MPAPMHYAKTPITEATIDIRVALPDGANMVQLTELTQRLLKQFPESMPVYERELFLQVEAEGQSSDKTEQVGFRLMSADKHKIAHIQLNGLAFSLLYPYDRWEPFRDDARGLWETYREVLRPTRITRVAVRYINRLDIPHESVELKKYLRTVPEISEDLSQTVLSYFMQLVIPQEDILATAVINQAIVPPPTPETTSVILDIDLFREKDIPDSDEGIWAVFEQLREGKNKIFKACLTPDAEELIS